MPSLSRASAEERLAAARVAHLATVTADGEPHVVPVCFALASGRIVTAVDAKPKTSRALRRLDNVRATGRASLLVDHDEEDWARLWWVRVDGPAEVVAAAGDALAALGAKYEQYRTAPPAGPVIALRPERWRSWETLRRVTVERLHVTRSRANPGGMDVSKVLGTETLPFRSRKPRWFKVPPPGGEAYRALDRMIKDARATLGLPGGGVPERRRLLGARHRHVHDPRRHLHAALRLLQRQDGQAYVQRPARAAARRPQAWPRWAFATRS